MALLDTDRDLLVIRIVYDGPALSGKTTTLRTLAGSLGREVFSGDEAEGRTLYFDWLDYTGGRFEGCPIRCQVVGVPGQRLLGARRRHLLAGADAVVFVADTRRAGFAASLRALEALREELRAGDPPRPGVVVQANKRDAPDAVAREDLRRALDAESAVALMESVATGGTGVRETFVFAVRLALDRVRELIRLASLPRGRPVVDSGVDLLAELRAREQLTEAAAGVREALAAENAVPARPGPQPAAATDESAAARPDGTRRERPRLPVADIPGGMIWPPIEGRITLHEALAAEPRVPAAELLTDGSWTAVLGGRWRMHSYERDAFLDPEAARAALIEWARWHGSRNARLSSRRCILATDAPPDAWRLWQVVRGERTLRAALEQALADPRPEQVARGLLDLSAALAEGRAACSSLDLPASLDTLGPAESGLVYVGLAPAVDRPAAPGAAPDLPFEELLRADFGPVLRRRAETSAFDVPRVADHIARLAAATGQPRAGEVLTAILIGH